MGKGTETGVRDFALSIAFVKSILGSKDRRKTKVSFKMEDGERVGCCYRRKGEEWGAM